MAKQVFATFDYEPAPILATIELSFKRGDTITVKQENSSNWWVGCLGNGAKGLFPANFTSASTENPGVLPVRGTFYQTMKFDGMPASPTSKKIVVHKGMTSRLPNAPAPSAPPPSVPVATAAAPPVQVAASAPVPAPVPIPVVQVADPPVKRAALGPVHDDKQLTLEQARALLAKPEPEKTVDNAGNKSRGPLLRTFGLGKEKNNWKRASLEVTSVSREEAAPAPVVGDRKKTGSSVSPRSDNDESGKGRKKSDTAASSPVMSPEIRPKKGSVVQRTIRGILKVGDGTTMRSKEAPAMLQSSPRPNKAEEKRKQLAAYQEMSTTKTQELAAQKFKNQVSRIYERENLDKVRQVFDGLAGSDAADEADRMAASAAARAEDEELEMLDEFATEKCLSRAALDLCSASPKVFLQLPDSPAERMRVAREMELTERRVGRQLWFDHVEEVAAAAASSASATSAAAAAGSISSPSGPTAKAREVASSQRSSGRARSGSVIGNMRTPPKDGMASSSVGTAGAGVAQSPLTASAPEELEDLNEVGFWDLLREESTKKKPVETEEVRRAQFLSQCMGSEWVESHSLKQRKWTEGSMTVPTYKSPSWALVEVAKDGLFHIEVGQKPPCDVPDYPLGTYKLEDTDCYRFWMKDFFLNARHQYFLCQPEESGAGDAATTRKRGGTKGTSSGGNGKEASVPSATAKETVLIVVRLGDEDRGDPSHVMTYHKHGTAHVQCLYSSTKQLEWFLRKSPYIKNLSLQGVRPYLNGPLDRHMLQWERGSVQKAFKFGVVYVANGQKTEDSFYSNERGSEEFRLFLARLGNVIALKGHTGYRAGLNVTHNLTGFLSVYNAVTFNEDGEFLYDLTSNPSLEDKDPNTLKFQLEVMFHVSTFLPFSPDNPQQLNRKRHIGNDVCVVVFKERSNSGLDATGKPIEANFPVPVGEFTSQFNHVFIVVTPWKFDAKGRTTHYKISVCSKDGVRPVRPYLPKNGIISVKKFTPWILAKLVNCERGSMYAPSFSHKEARTNLAMMAEAVAVTSSRGKK